MTVISERKQKRLIHSFSDQFPVTQKTGIFAQCGRAFDTLSGGKQHIADMMRMVYEQRWQQWKTLELEEESQLAESEFVIFLPNTTKWPAFIYFLVNCLNVIIISVTFIHEKLGKIQHKFSGPEVSHPNTCTSESMTYWLARGKQWFLLYLAGHWLEHALISPLIYIHLDNLGVLGRLKQRRTHKRDLCALNVISTYFYCVRSQLARIKGRSYLKNRLPAYGSRKMCNKCFFFFSISPAANKA